jgi:hypothetical protein
MLNLTISPSVNTIIKGVLTRGIECECCPTSIKDISEPIQSQYTQLREELGQEVVDKVSIWWVDFVNADTIQKITKN